MFKLLRTGLLIGGGALLLGACAAQTGQDVSENAPPITQASPNSGSTTVPAATITPTTGATSTSTADPQLDQDQKAIDSEMNQLENDSSNVDKSLSDTPINVNQ